MLRSDRRSRMAAAFVALALATGVAGAEQAAGAISTPGMYLYHLSHTGFEAREKTINASNVSTLAPKWIVQANETISSQAIAADGLIYWGSWDGLEHATNPE